MKGLTVSEPKGPVLLVERPVPKLRPGYMIVKPDAVALNPADVHRVDWGMCISGALLGCDYAGTVVEVGEGTTRGWKKGDRVCGATRSADKSNFENGTFAELICVKADLQLRVPDGMSSAQASALGVNILTTGRAFYDKMKIPYPTISDDGVVDTAKQPRRQILVYGGSSAMGTMYIQYAKLSNFYILTTCSLSNSDLVKSYGADYVIDYKSPTAVADLIKHATENESTMGKLEMCLDAISTETSGKFCSEVLNPSGVEDGSTSRLYSTILPWIPPLDGITKYLTLGYSFLGEEWEQFGTTHPANMQDFECSKRFAELATKLIAAGKIRAHPVDEKKGGLAAVVSEGFEELRKGVSGKKLVFPLES